MSNIVQIIANGQEHSLGIREYRSQRVITFKDIDTLHGRSEGAASRNFRENRERFIKNEDYFEIDQPDEIRRLGFERPQGGTPEKIILLTESGYLMLAKSFTDDLAWQVQRQLINIYFCQRETHQIPHESIKKTLMTYDPMAYALYLSTFLPADSPEIREINKQISWREGLNANSLQCYVGFHNHKVGHICIEEMIKQYAIDEKYCFYCLRDKGLVEDRYLGINPKNHLSIFETRLTDAGRNIGGEEVKHTKKSKDKAGGQLYAFRFPELKFLELYGVWITANDFELSEYIRIATSKIEDYNRPVMAVLGMTEAHNEVRKITRKSVFNSRQELEEYEKQYPGRKR